MSGHTPMSLERAIEAYQRFWIEGASTVLKSLSPSAVSAEALTPDSLDEGCQLWTHEGRWVRYGATEPLSGELALLVSRGSAEKVAQIPGLEIAEDPTGPDGARKDPLVVLLGKFAVAAADHMREAVGGSVAFPLQSTDAPEWAPVARFGISVTPDHSPPVAICIQVSSELAESLQQTLKSEEPESAGVGAGQANPAETDLSNIHVGLLSSVELPATLRFGETQLTLGEVMEFGAGTAVELDQPLHQQAELVVAGTVVARGEIVIVDGNFGIQIKEIAAPEVRMSGLSNDARRAFEMLSARHGKV